MKTKEKIAASAGRKKADMLFVNANVINVFTGEILRENVAVSDGYICGSGDYDALETVDMEGMYMAPGFMDSHVHIESAMVTPEGFARAVLPHGTTTVIADPHEIANVLGLPGILMMMESAEALPMNILFALPSCVPATDMETSGAVISAEEMRPLFHHRRIVALAEMMNYPGVICSDPGVMEKLAAAEKAGKSVDGHAPGLSGKGLAAYAAAGILSDHECTSTGEAMEKLRLGINIMVREGTCARNLDDLLPAVTDHTWRRMMWCTDDRHPDDILSEGHVDYIIRKAIKAGINPIRAIQMGTINCADYFGIKDAGAIAPGRRADMVLFRDLENPVIERTYSGGELVASNGVFNSGVHIPEPVFSPPPMELNTDNLDFSVKVQGNKIRVIRVVPNQVLTTSEIMPVCARGGMAVSDIDRDMIKIAVAERYSGKTAMAVGFVTGLGLKHGAIASSVAHDSHNIIVAGVNDEDMLFAVKSVKKMGGGFTVVCDGAVLENLPLPVGGLMSTESLETVCRSMKRVISAAKHLGSSLSDPFMTLGFMALPVIPELKITDKGLVDVLQFKLTDLFV